MIKKVGDNIHIGNWGKKRTQKSRKQENNRDIVIIEMEEKQRINIKKLLTSSNDIEVLKLCYPIK